MPVAIAPNPLAPGFARTWPDCQAAMCAIARHLIARGADDEEVMLCLMGDFPYLPAAPGTAWGSEAVLAKVTAQERHYLSSRPDISDNWRDEPSGYEMQVVDSAGELLRLCASYGISITHDAETDQLHLSGKIMVGGPCHTLIKRYKSEIARMAAVCP